MNSKLKISAAILFVFISVVGSKAQFGAAPGAPAVFDPATGAPVAPAVPEWKDPKWKDPEITLTNVVYDSLPLSEVAKSLSEQFKQQFDVLLPAFRNDWQSDWLSESITLHLKNVTASEIFSAMNLVFENNRTPLRWELKLNGHRQIALLRVLVDPVPQANPLAAAPAPEIKRRVYWMGNLIGDEKNGGMTMDQIINTVTDVWRMADRSGKGVTTSALGVEIGGGTIQFHKDAQLLVVTGTPEQVDFVEQTLKALEQKADQGSIVRARRSGTEQILKDVEQKASQEKTNSRTPLR